MPFMPNDVVAALERLRLGLCTYMGDRCDCKYLPDEGVPPSSMSLGRRGEQTGCCEVRAAIARIRELEQRVAWLEDEVCEWQRDPCGRDAFRQDAADALGMTPEEYAAWVERRG